MSDMIKKGSKPVSEILQGMINSTETISRVTVKTTVQTDEAIHNVWQTSNKYSTATFTNTKKKK